MPHEPPAAAHIHAELEAHELHDTLRRIGDWLAAFFASHARDLSFHPDAIRDGAHHPFKVVIRVRNQALNRDIPFVRVEPLAFLNPHTNKRNRALRVVFTCCAWPEIRALATERSPDEINDIGTHRTIDFHAESHADLVFLNGRGCAVHLCEATHRYQAGGVLPYLAKLTREMFTSDQPFASQYREAVLRDE